jgi:hypothetical protein
MKVLGFKKMSDVKSLLNNIDDCLLYAASYVNIKFFHLCIKEGVFIKNTSYRSERIISLDSNENSIVDKVLSVINISEEKGEMLKFAEKAYCDEDFIPGDFIFYYYLCCKKDKLSTLIFENANIRTGKTRWMELLQYLSNSIHVIHNFIKKGIFTEEDLVWVIKGFAKKFQIKVNMVGLEFKKESSISSLLKICKKNDESYFYLCNLLNRL